MLGAGEGVKLVGHWVSGFVIRVRIALNLKKIDYEFLEEVIGSDGHLAKSDLLLKLNPVYKKIPVLIHDGKPISESLIIVQYIDEMWPTTGPSILPSDPYERAVARFWAVYIDEWGIVKLVKFFGAKIEEEKADALQQVTEGLHLLEKAFTECSKGRGFFGGDKIGYVDIVLGSKLGWIEAAEELSGVNLLDEAKTPQLVGWAARFRSDEAVKEVLPESSKFAEYGKAVRARRNAQATN